MGTNSICFVATKTHTQNMHPGQVAGLTAALAATLVTLVAYMMIHSGSSDESAFTKSVWHLRSADESGELQTWYINTELNAIKVVQKDGDGSLFVQETFLEDEMKRRKEVAERRMAEPEPAAEAPASEAPAAEEAAEEEPAVEAAAEEAAADSGESEAAEEPVAVEHDAGAGEEEEKE